MTFKDAYEQHIKENRERINQKLDSDDLKYSISTKDHKCIMSVIYYDSTRDCITNDQDNTTIEENLDDKRSNERIRDLWVIYDGWHF